MTRKALPHHLDAEAENAQIARYRQAAANLRGNDLFEMFVRSFVVIFHAEPTPEREAEFFETANIVKAIVRVRAEDNGHDLAEWHLSEIAGAMMYEAMMLLAQSPTEGGRA